MSVDERGRGPSFPVWLTIPAKLALTALVTVFVVRAVGFGMDDLAALGPGWWRPRWGMALLASMVLTAGYGVSALLWGWMVRDLGGRSVAPARAVRIFLTANLARYVPGKVWQIAGLAILARREGVGPVVAGTAAILGQGAALGGATVIGAVTLVASDGPVRMWGWAALGIVGLGALLSLVPSAADRMMKAWFRVTRADPDGGLRLERTFGLRWLAFYIINWMIYAAAFVLLANSYGISTNAVQVGGAFAAAYVIGYIAIFAPAGIGVRESFLVVFLSPVMGPVSAGGLAVASRVWTTGVEILTALAANARTAPDSSVDP